MDPTSRPERIAFRRWAPSLCLLAAWAIGAPLQTAELRVVGSDLLAPALPEALAAFARQEATAVRTDLRGTRPGLEELRAGRTELGLCFFPPGERPPSGFISYVIGYHAVAVVVPTELPLSRITLDQLHAIFAADGAAVRWEDIGVTGQNAARLIAPMALTPRAGLALPLFQRLVLHDAALKASVEHCASPEQLLARLRATGNSIGLAPALPAAAMPGLRILPVAESPQDAAHAPTAEALHGGRYSLRLPLLAVFRRADAARLLPLLKFLLGAEGVTALGRAGVVPLSEAERNRLGLLLEEHQ